jgi:hypothetical protein
MRIVGVTGEPVRIVVDLAPVGSGYFFPTLGRAFEGFVHVDGTLNSRKEFLERSVGLWGLGRLSRRVIGCALLESLAEFLG